MITTKMYLSIVLLGAATLVVACKHDDPAQAVDPRSAPAQVQDNGMVLQFGEQSPQLQQIAVDTVRCHAMKVGIFAPAHIAVSVVPSETGAGPLYLFESQDITQLYSDFVKSGSAIERSSKALARTRDLAAHKIVPEKDVIDAENDHAQAEAERAQLESRLRAAGIDPKSLKATTAGNVWVMADVPETQLALIRTGAPAAVACNAYPGERFTGTIASVGDVLDPTTRTAKVRIVLSNRGGKLRPGMVATATFDETSANAVSVPRTAVVNVQGKSYVFAQTAPGVFRRTEVRIGAETPEAYLVNSGVEANQQVASGGVMLLKGLSFGY